MDVKNGIGQGTILKPLLLIFYINDLVSVTDTLKINMTFLCPDEEKGYSARDLVLSELWRAEN